MKGFWAWFMTEEECRGEGRRMMNSIDGHWVWCGPIENPGKNRQVFLGKDLSEAQENMWNLLENDRKTRELITS